MKPTYEELEAKCQLQQNKLDAINKLMGVIESASDLAKDGIKKLEQQLAAVVAENASVKAMNDCLSEELRGYESDGAFDGPKMHLLWWQCETPATDAAIANIQAQGVEMLVNHCEQKALEKSYDFFMDAGAVAAQFAAQLRQGGEHD